MSELRLKESLNGAMLSCSNSPLVDHLDHELLAEKQMDKTVYSSIGHTQSSEIQGSVNLVKRKRGRPRRQPLDGEVAKPDNKPKRGRGRPRKYPIEETYSDFYTKNPIVNQNPAHSDTSSFHQVEQSDEMSGSNVYQSPRVAVFEVINKDFSGKPFVNKPSLNFGPNEYPSIHSNPDQLPVNMSRNMEKYRSKGLTKRRSKSVGSLCGPIFDSWLKCEICNEQFSSEEHYSYHLHKHFDSYDDYTAHMRVKKGNATRSSSTSTQNESPDYDGCLNDSICTSYRNSTGGSDRSSVVEWDTESTLSASETEFPIPKARALKKDVKVSLEPISTDLMTKYKLFNKYSAVKTGSARDRNGAYDMKIKPESGHSMLPLDEKYVRESGIIVSKSDYKITIKYGDETKNKAQGESLNKKDKCKAVVDKGQTLADKEPVKQDLNNSKSSTDSKKRKVLNELIVNQTEKDSNGIVDNGTFTRTKCTKSKSKHINSKSIDEAYNSSPIIKFETGKNTDHQRNDRLSAKSHKGKCTKERESFSNQFLTKLDTCKGDTNTGSLADNLEIQVMRFEEKDVVMRHARLPSNSPVSPEKIRRIKDQRLLKQQVAFKRMPKVQHKLNLENYPNKKGTSVFNTFKKHDEVSNISDDSYDYKGGSPFIYRPSEKHLKLKSASTNGYKLEKDKCLRSKPVAKEKHTHGSSQGIGPFTHQLKSQCNAPLRNDKDSKQLNKHEGASKHLAKGRGDKKISKSNITNHLAETCGVDPCLSDVDNFSKTKQTKVVECQSGISYPHLKERSLVFRREGNQPNSPDIDMSNQHVYMQTDRTVKDQDHIPHLHENSSVRQLSPLDESRSTTFSSETESLPGSERHLEDIELARNLGFSLSDASSDGEEICLGDYSKNEIEALEECTGLSNIVIPFSDVNISSPCCSQVINDCNLKHTAQSTPPKLNIEESRNISSEVKDSFRDVKVDPQNDFDEPDSLQHCMSTNKVMNTVCPSPSKTGDLNIHQLPASDSCLSLSNVSCKEAEKKVGQALKLCQKDTDQDKDKTDVTGSDSGQILVKTDVHQSDSEQILVKTDADQSVTDRDAVNGISSVEAEISHQSTGQHSDEDFSITNPNECGPVSPGTDLKKHEPGQLSVKTDQNNSVLTLPITYPNSKRFENIAVKANRMLCDSSLDKVSSLKACVMHQCNSCNKRFRTYASLKLHGCNGHSPDSVITIGSDSDTDPDTHQDGINSDIVPDIHRHHLMGKFDTDENADEHQRSKSTVISSTSNISPIHHFDENSAGGTSKHKQGVKKSSDKVVMKTADMKTNVHQEVVKEGDKFKTINAILKSKPQLPCLTTKQNENMENEVRVRREFLESSENFEITSNIEYDHTKQERTSHYSKPKENTPKLEKKKKLKINREVAAVSKLIKCPLCNFEVTSKSFFQHKLSCKPPISHQSTGFDNKTSKALETDNSVDDTDTSTEVSRYSGNDLRVVLKKVKLSNSIINGTSLKVYGSLENPMWKIDTSKDTKRDEFLSTKTENIDADNQNVDESCLDSTVKHSVDIERDDSVASDNKENENSVIGGKLDRNSEYKPSSPVTVPKNKKEARDKVTKGYQQRDMEKLTISTESTISKGESITDFEKQLLVVDHSLEKGKDRPKKRHRSVRKTPQKSKIDLHVESQHDRNKEEAKAVPQKHFINSKMAQTIYKRDKKRNQSLNDGLPDFSKSGVKLDSLPNLVIGKSSGEVDKNTPNSNIIEDKSYFDESSNMSLSHKERKKSIEFLGIVPNSTSKEMLFDPAEIRTEHWCQNRCYGSIDSTFSLHSYKIPKFDLKDSKFSAFGSMKGFTGNDSHYSPNSTSCLKSSNLSEVSGEESEISSVGIGGTDSSSFEREDDSLRQQKNGIYFDKETSVSFGREKHSFGFGQVNNSISFDQGIRRVSFDWGNHSVSFDRGNNSGSSCGENNISRLAGDDDSTTISDPSAIFPQDHSMPISENAFHNSGFDTTKHQRSELSSLGHTGTWEKIMDNHNLERSEGQTRNWSGVQLRREGVLTSTPYVKHAGTEKKREVNEMSQLSCILDQTEVSIKRRRLNGYQIDVEDKRIVKTKRSSDDSTAGCQLQSTNKHTKRSPIRFPKGAVIEKKSRKESQTKELLQITLEEEPTIGDFHGIESEEEASLGGFDEKNMYNEEFEDVTDELPSMDDKKDQETQLRDESDKNSSISDLIADEFDVDIEDIVLGDEQELTEDTCRNDGNNVKAKSENDDTLKDLNSDMDAKNDKPVQEKDKSDIEDRETDIENTKSDLEDSENDLESVKSNHNNVNSMFSDLEDSIVEDGEDNDTKVKTPIKKAEHVELTEITEDVLYLSDPDMDMFDEESIHEEDNGEMDKESLPVEPESGDDENDLDTPAECEVGSDSIGLEETKVMSQTPKWETAKRPMWLPRGYCFNFFNNRRCAVSTCTYNHNLPSQMEFLQSFKDHLEKGDDEICLDILQGQPNIHDKISNVQLEILHRRLCDNVESFWLLKIMNNKGTLNQIVVDNYIRAFGQIQHSDYLFGVFEMARAINMTFQPDVLSKLLEVFSSQEDLLEKLIAVLTYCTEDETFLLPAKVIQTAIKGVLKEPRLLNQLLVILTSVNQLPLISQDLIDRLCEVSSNVGNGKEKISQLQNLFKRSSQLYSHSSVSLLDSTGFDDSVEWSQQDEIFWMDNVKSVKYTKNFSLLASLYNEKRCRGLPFTTEECDLYIDVIVEDKAFVDGTFRQFLESVMNTQSEGTSLLFKQQFGYIACRLFASCFNYKLLPACTGILSTMHMYDLLPMFDDLFVLNAVKVCLHGALAELAVAILKGVKLNRMRPQVQADLVTLFNPLIEQLTSKKLKTECLFVLHWSFLLVYNGKPNVIDRERLIRLPSICYSLINTFLDDNSLKMAVSVYSLLEQFGQSFPFHKEMELKLMSCLATSEYRETARRIYEKLKKLNVYKPQAFVMPRKITIPCLTGPNIKSEVLLIVSDYLLCLYNILCNQVTSNMNGQLEYRDLYLKVVILRSVNQTNLLLETKAVLEKLFSPPLFSSMEIGCLLIEPESLRNYLKHLDKRGLCQGLTFNRKPGSQPFQKTNMQRR